MKLESLVLLRFNDLIGSPPSLDILSVLMSAWKLSFALNGLVGLWEQIYTKSVWCSW